MEKKYGYARYVGPHGSKKINSRWRETGFAMYEFIQDVWYPIYFKEDWKDFVAKAQFNEEWEAKARVTKGDRTIQGLEDARNGLTPEEDDQAEEHIGLLAQMTAIKTKFAKMKRAEFDRLPPEVKRAKAELDKYLTELEKEGEANTNALKKEKNRLSRKGKPEESE